MSKVTIYLPVYKTEFPGWQHQCSRCSARVTDFHRQIWKKRWWKVLILFFSIKVKQFQTARKDSVSVYFESEHLSSFSFCLNLHSYYREMQTKISDSKHCKPKPEIWSKFCKRALCHLGRVLILNSDTPQFSDICHNNSRDRKPF